MSDFIETPNIDAILSLDEAREENGEMCLLLTVHLESGKTVRLPMSVEIAMRALSLLARAREEHGWPLPDAPTIATKLQ